MVNFDFFYKCDNKSNLKHPNKDANFPRNDYFKCVFEIQTIDPCHAMMVISTRFI